MKLLSDIPRSAKCVITFQPMWSLFGWIVRFYAPLYMDGMGLTKIEMGIISSINLFMSFIFHFLASPINNRLGRKKTLLIADVLCWSVPMLIWAVAQNFWYFLAAGTINSIVKVSSIAWTCLLSEDADKKVRPKIFSIIQVVNTVPGIFVIFVGMAMEKAGVVPTMRVLYILGFISMTAAFIIRNMLLKETKAGKEIMEKHSSMTAWESFKEYFALISKVFGRIEIIKISLIYVILFFAMSINFYQVLFIKEYLGFSDREVSFIPAINAITNLLLFIFVVSRIRNFRPERVLAFSMILSSIGSISLLIIPAKSLPGMLTTISILALGSFLSVTHRDTVFMNNLGEHEKGDMLSAVQTMTTLVSIPSGYLAGYAYSLNPTYPFIIIFFLFVIGAGISITIGNNNKKIKNSTAESI